MSNRETQIPDKSIQVPVTHKNEVAEHSQIFNSMFHIVIRKKGKREKGMYQRDAIHPTERIRAIAT